MRKGLFVEHLLVAVALLGVLAAGGRAGATEPLAPLAPPPIQPAGLVELGRALFHDLRLSGDGTVNCAHCHPLARGGVDGLPVSLGVKARRGVANAPTVYNLAGQIAYFWDGRAATLEDLVLEGPLQNPNEMDTNWEEVLAKLGRDAALERRFRELFPRDGLTARNVARAIAAFLRSLVTLDSPFDRWLRGDRTALDERQIEGYRLFRSYGCVACHQGANVGGNLFAVVGVMADFFSERNRPESPVDQGRFNVTGNEADRHVFKVPSLRLVTFTAPYFHDGSVKTLDEAVVIMGRYQLGREIPAQERRDIVAFLRSLAGRHPLLEATR